MTDSHSRCRPNRDAKAQKDWISNVLVRATNFKNNRLYFFVSKKKISLSKPKQLEVVKHKGGIKRKQPTA